MDEDFLKSLSVEQKARTRNCRAPEDLPAFTKKAGCLRSVDMPHAAAGMYRL